MDHFLRSASAAAGGVPRACDCNSPANLIDTPFDREPEGVPSLDETQAGFGGPPSGTPRGGVDQPEPAIRGRRREYPYPECCPVRAAARQARRWSPPDSRVEAARSSVSGRLATAASTCCTRSSGIGSLTARQVNHRSVGHSVNSNHARHRFDLSAGSTGSLSIRSTHPTSVRGGQSLSYTHAGRALTRLSRKYEIRMTNVYEVKTLKDTPSPRFHVLPGFAPTLCARIEARERRLMKAITTKNEPHEEDRSKHDRLEEVSDRPCGSFATASVFVFRVFRG